MMWLKFIYRNETKQNSLSFVVRHLVLRFTLSINEMFSPADTLLIDFDGFLSYILLKISIRQSLKFKKMYFMVC